MDWEIPRPEALLEYNLTTLVNFAAAGCGFYGSIEDLVVNWIHPFMLSAKPANTNGENTIWRQAMNVPFDGEYWEAAGIEVENMESMKA